MSRLELRDYQQVAKGFIQHNPRSALFLDMGLGKTATVLSALGKEHFPALVVAPKRVAEEVWPEERDIWRPDLTMQLAAGTLQQRTAAIHTPSDITVVAREHIAEVARKRWKTVIIDELSGYKSRGGARWKILNRMVNAKASSTQYVWGLTGTPSPNGLMDLWAQIYLLDKGARLGSGIGVYRERFFYAAKRLPNGIVTKWVLQEGADKKIHALVQDICLSMGTEGRVHLPPIHHNEIVVKMNKRETDIYAKLRKEMVADLTMLGGEIHTAKNAAALSSKLSQLTAGFIYSDEYEFNAQVTSLHKLKIAALREIQEGTPSPLLVAYRFRAERDHLLEAFPEASTVETPGVFKAWNRGEVPMLITHPASIGHGLNLQHGGHTIVWMSLDWSLEYWDQFNKRLHRSGQRNPVVIHRIMARSANNRRTIDYTILDRLTGKATVQQALTDHLESPI